MRKKLWAAALCCALLLCLLTGCSPSPTAVRVGDRKVDASEYAFYLYYNSTNTGEDSGTILYDDAALQTARELALEQIVTNEVVRLKCSEFGLALSEAQQSTLSLSKSRLVESLGGKAAYLDYLRQTYLTDRAYDKFQANAYYYDLLYTYMAQEGQTYFTDEKLRQYFSGHYATVKYVYLSLLDENGQPLDQELREEQQAAAQTVLEQARSGETDFDSLMLQYNEDPMMTVGFPISEPEARSTDYLTTLFDLEENGVSDIITTTDGYYILKRCPVSATYYDENQTDIYQAALDERFAQTLDEWKEEYPVTVEKIVDKINLSNLGDYVK